MARAAVLMVTAGLAALPAAAEANAVLVRLAPGVRPDRLGMPAQPVVPRGQAARLAAQVGRRGGRMPDLSRWVLVPVPRGADADAVRARLVTRRGVRWARPLPARVPAPPGESVCRAVPGDFGVPPKTLAPGAAPPSLAAFEDVRAHMDFAGLPAGGDGAGVRVADVEYDWDPSHVELADRALPTPVRSPLVAAGEISHGTAVLSLIGGRADGVGITGLVPAAQLVPVVPWNNGLYSPAAGIAAAAAQLRAGDVLLVEQQSNAYGPADAGVYGGPVADAVAAATAKGVVVVLPAGNGLRRLTDAEEAVHDEAIVVGAGEIPEGGGVLAAKASMTDFGARVDVQGPGHAVTAATSNPANGGGMFPYLVGGDNATGRSYTHCFSGTSSASAAVAGAIAAMQGVARASRGTPFTIAEIRARLRATGIAQADPQNGAIGPLPQVAHAASLTPPPTVTLLAPAAGGVTAGTVTVEWRPSDVPGAPAPDAVLLDGAVVATPGAGDTRATLTVPAGAHRIEVRSTDALGNSAAAGVDVVADSGAYAVTAGGAGTTPVPPPPGGTPRAVAAPWAGTVLWARWDRRRGALTIRVHTVPGTRLFVDAHPAAVRRGVVIVPMRRPGNRTLVVRANGHKPRRMRVTVTRDGRVRLVALR